MVETPPVVEAVNDLIDLHEEHQGIAPPDTLQELATPEEVLRKVQEVLQYLTDVQEATIIPEKVNPDGEGFDVDEIYRQIDEAKAIAALAIRRPDYKPILIPGTLSFGVPAAAYESGATIVLDPCDAVGTDTGEDNVTLDAAWTLPDNTNIPITAIIPYYQNNDGGYTILGQPREVITNMRYDTATHKLQKKVRYDFGVFATTESSAWVDVTTAVDCTA